MGAGASAAESKVPTTIEEARAMGFTEDQIKQSALWKRLEKERKQAEFNDKYPSMGGGDGNVFGDNKHLLPESAEELYAQGITRDEE